MEVLGQEKSRLRRKIVVETTNDKDKEKDIHVESKTPMYNNTHMTKEESEYNPTPRTTTTTHITTTHKTKH